MTIWQVDNKFKRFVFNLGFIISLGTLWGVLTYVAFHDLRDKNIFKTKDSDIELDDIQIIYYLFGYLILLSAGIVAYTYLEIVFFN